MTAVPDPRLVERWRTTFAMWRSSDLSVAAFCRSRELHLSTFDRWRKGPDDLDRSVATRPRSQPDPLPVQSVVPVRVTPDAVVEVILPSGVQLRLPLSADARQLARLVLASGAAPC